MAVCVLGILVATQRQKPAWLTLAWVGSVFAKVSTVVLAPFVISRWQRHHWSMALLGSLAVLVVWWWLPRSITSSYLNTLESQLSILHRSLPQQIVALTSSLGMLEPHVMLFLNSVWFVVLLRLWWLRQRLSMAEIVTWVFVSYLLIAAPMVQPWYGLWFLPALWFGQRQFWWKAAQAVLLSGLLTYVVYNLSLWMAPLWFGWQTILYATVAIPLVALYLWKRVILKAVS